MDGAIVDFEQLFIFEAIDYAEESFGRSGRDGRTGMILGRQAACNRGDRGILWLGPEAKNASEKKAETEKGVGRWRKPVASALRRAAEKFGEGNALAARGQVNGPDVVQRDAGEKGMHAKGERVKLGWRNLRHL